MIIDTGWSMKQENNGSRDSLIETERAETFLKRSDEKVKCHRKVPYHKGFQSPGLEPMRSLLLLGRASSMKGMLPDCST